LAISELSVEVWVKATQPWRAKQWPGSATLITKATGGPGSSDWTINAGAFQGGENEGRILTSTGAAGSGTDTNLGSGQGLNDGQWHHVVWTRWADGFNSLYVDGRLADQAEDEGGPIANDRPIQIGGDPHQGGTFLDGALAEAALYATVLDAGRVRAHAVAGGLAVPVCAPPKPLESLALKSSAGLNWELWRGEHGWSLGQISLNGKPLENPATSGILALRDVKSGEVRWLPADQAERIGLRAARLSGQTKIGDATLRFGAEIALQEKLPAATWTASWSVDNFVWLTAHLDGRVLLKQTRPSRWAVNQETKRLACAELSVGRQQQEREDFADALLRCTRGADVPAGSVGGRLVCHRQPFGLPEPDHLDGENGISLRRSPDGAAIPRRRRIDRGKPLQNAAATDRQRCRREADAQDGGGIWLTAHLDGRVFLPSPATPHNTRPSRWAVNQQLPGGRYAQGAHAAGGLQPRPRGAPANAVLEAGHWLRASQGDPVCLRGQQSDHCLLRVPPVRDHRREGVA
jgi:hypothetical protein